MTTLLLMSVAVTTVLVLCGTMYAVMTLPVFQPLPAGPFAPGTDPSADTNAGQAQVNTVFADTGWQTATLHKLCDVEDLLAYLEANRFDTREVHTLGNNVFCVRWK